MELDLAHYSKDLIVEDSADEISAVLLNEVNRGGTEKLHKFDYKPRYQNFDKTLLLNLDNFRFLNSRKFEDGDIAHVQEMITARAYLDPTAGDGIAFFGTEILLGKISVLFKSSEGTKNQIKTTVKLKIKEEQNSYKIAPSERLDLTVNLASTEFEMLRHDIELNEQKSSLQLEIVLHENCGIYQNQVNSTLKSYKNVVKILPQEILSLSQINSTHINCIDGNIFNGFSFTWVSKKLVQKAGLHDENLLTQKTRNNASRGVYQSGYGVGATWTENLAWVFILIAGFAGVLALIDI